MKIRNLYVHSENKLAALLFFLLFTYFAKFSNLASVDATMIGWMLVSIYALLKVNNFILIKSSSVYIGLLLFYLFGFYTSSAAADADYEKHILTFIFFTPLVMQYLKDGSDFEYEVNSSYFNVMMLNAIYLCVAFWILFVVYASQSMGDFVVSEYGGANYLTTSDLLAMMTLAIIGSRKINFFHSLIYLGITLIALALLGSRASIALFLLSYFFSLDRKYWIKSIVFAVIFIGVVLIIYRIIEDFEGEMFYRLKTIFDLADDESKEGRAFFFSNHLDHIASNPACFIIPCHPTPGDYVHNIFSIHQYFGLPIQLIVFYLIAVAVIKLLNGYSTIFLPLFIYVLTQSMFFRSWHSLTFPVFVAFLLFIYVSENGQKGAVK